MSKRQPKVDYWQTSPMPRGQLVLFPSTLEDRIPADHPVRAVDEMLDRLDWSEWEAKYNGRSGQPPIHPSILCKVLLFAILRGIRSSRKIEYEVKHSIDFIWLVSGRTLDHSTLSAFRRDHQQQVKKMYRDMVRLAIELGVAKLSELCIDGTRVLADANRYKTLTAEKAQRLDKSAFVYDEAADAKERYKRRQHAGETPFAVIKACFGLRRFLLRGIEGVQTEWLWHCTAFNLKRMLNLLASVRADDKETPQPAIS